MISIQDLLGLADEMWPQLLGAKWRGHFQLLSLKLTDHNSDGEYKAKCSEPLLPETIQRWDLESRLCSGSGGSIQEPSFIPQKTCNVGSHYFTFSDLCLKVESLPSQEI